ncbi:MAG: hypothetical protein K0S47_2390 [Herbinix sp.]|jgi:predicted DNA-binding protein (MmcQ/YjbR family)|nr:hypothetical protein [Herbinix sp.]
MTAEGIKTYCLQKPGAYEVTPFGPIPICYKVGNRIFLELYPRDEDYKITIRSEMMLTDYYRSQYPGVVIPGYHCPERQRRYKNTIYMNRGLADDVVFDMIDHSYRDAVSKCTKKERMLLL